MDTYISPEGAKIQVKGIAGLRNIPEQDLIKLVDAHNESPLIGLFVPPKVNVLKLNIALDEMKKAN